MQSLRTIKHILDFLCGSREDLGDSPGLPAWLVVGLRSTMIRGLWWVILLVIILFFSGQTSKFIYIDF